MGLQVVRLVAVLALLCVAAAIATPKGRLPLALRGLAKMLLRSCDVENLGNRDPSQPPAWKRVVAFALVVLAVILALI